MIDERIFQDKQVKWSALSDFGFIRQGDSFVYKETFMDGQFEACVEIFKDGKVQAEIWDWDLSEPYLGHLVRNPRGGFVKQVREYYVTLLERMVSSCFESPLYPSSQADRLNAYIEEQLGDSADFPFKRLPEARVFRCPTNQKWYALILRVQRDKLYGSQRSSKEEQEVTILNIKIRKEDLEPLLRQEGYYPSYHMSKSSWITVVLDDAISDQDLFALVETSKNLVASKN